MLLRELFLLNPHRTGAKIMQLGQVFIIVPDTFKKDRHFVKSNVPKIRSQSVFSWASSQSQARNLLRLCSNLL